MYDTLGEYTAGVVFQEPSALLAFWRDHLHDFRLVYQPLNPTEEFEAICRLVWAAGDCVFLVEELDTFCGPTSIPTAFANIIQRGRHRHIDFIGVSQRPYGINRLISAQAKEIISFQQSEPRDLDYLSAYLGQDVEKVRDLPAWTYLHWQAPDRVSIERETA